MNWYELDDTLRELGIELPQPSLPGANYVPYVRTGDLLYVTGQLSQWNGERKFIGKLGREFSLAEGAAAARLSALNVIAQLRAALRAQDESVHQCIRIGGFVNATPDFHGHSRVINGASDLLIEVLADAGRHTRVAVGVSALPYDVAVEVEAIFEVGSEPRRTTGACPRCIAVSRCEGCCSQPRNLQKGS